MLRIVAEPVPLAVDNDGIVRVAGTRVTLDAVVGAYNNGLHVEEIVDAYPVLALADVHAVIAYYLRHREGVDRYIEANLQAAEGARRDYERRFGAQPMREELEARRNWN